MPFLSLCVLLYNIMARLVGLSKVWKVPLILSLDVDGTKAWLQPAQILCFVMSMLFNLTGDLSFLDLFRSII